MITTDYLKSAPQSLMRPTLEGLNNLFTYHPPTGDQGERYEQLRIAAKAFALLIITYCPPSPDTTAAIRKLRECVMTANAAIATGEPEIKE